jgi:hypothetical protein
MEPINSTHESKGRGHPTRGVLDQAKYSREQYTKFLADLIAKGMKETFVSDLDKAIADVEEIARKRRVVKDDSSSLTRAQQAAVDSANSFKRILWASLGLVLQPNDESQLTLDRFVSGKINNSPARLSVYLNEIKPHVETLDERLKPYFGGTLASAKLAEVKAALDNVQSKQEAATASSPLETKRLNAAKGRLLELIEHGNAVARIAFDGNPDVRDLFNKDLLKRSHKRIGKPEDEEESAAADSDTDSADSDTTSSDSADDSTDPTNPSDDSQPE